MLRRAHRLARSPSPLRTGRLRARTSVALVLAAVLGLGLVAAAAVALSSGAGHAVGSASPEPRPLTARAPVAARRPQPAGAARPIGGRNTGVQAHVVQRLPEPTASRPLRVLEIGDSLGIDLGVQLQSELDATRLAAVTMAAQGDTGLCNADFFDWPAQLQTMLTQDRPDLLVVFLGANDAQSLSGSDASFGTPAWVAGYAQRVDTVLAEARARHVAVVWVGMPAMQQPQLNAEMAELDTIFQQEVAKDPDALYVPSDPVLSPGHQFVSTGGPPGDPVTTRAPDGIHVTGAGGQLLVGSLVAALDQHWHLSLPV